MIIGNPLLLLASCLAVAAAAGDQPTSIAKEDRYQERLLQDATTASSDLLQEVVSELTLLLPDFQLTERILFNDLNVAATNVECVDISLGNFQVSVPNSKNDELTLQVDASQLDVVCTMNYDFSYTAILFPLTGKGTLTMVLNENSLSAGFNFVTDGEKFDTHPPYNVTMDACEAIFTIDDMEFMQSEGSTSEDMLDSMDGLIRGFVEDSIGETLCEEFGGEMEWVLRDMVEGIYGVMEPYLGELQEVPNREVVVSAADGVKLINYTASKTYNGEEDLVTQLMDNSQEQPWLTTLVGYVNNLGLGEMDPEANDLTINVLMREYLLEENTGALTVDNIDQVPFLTDLLESNLESFAGDDDDDSITLPVNATLQSLSIYGLDSFTNFALLEANNAYTLNNELQLGYLKLEITVRLQSLSTDMGEESLIADPNGALGRVLEGETVKLTFQLDDVQINAAVLLAIDENLFGQLGLGSILYNTDILVDCLLSSVVQSELTNLQVQIGNLATPTLEGALLEASPMLNNALTTVVEAGMAMYENAILRMIPNMVQTTLQDLLNDSFFSTTNADDGNPAAACPQLVPTGNDWLDFRDLFMEQSESRRLGGSGSQPYGSLVPYLYNFGMSFLASPSNIASLFTLATSDLANIDGTSLSFPGQVMGDQIRIWLGNLDARISYSVFDIRLDNMVDSIGEQIVMLDPVMNEPTWLNNSITAGVNDKPLRLTARVMLDVNSNIEKISNHFIISADVGSLAMTVTALLKVMEDRYSTFPIRDLFHVDCWMAMILPPLLNEYGVREEGEELTAGIHAMSILAKEINMNIECLVCSSPGLVEMEQLWSTPDVQKDFTEIGNSLFGGAADIAEKFLQLEVDRRLNDAALRCPHSPQYDETFNGFSFKELRVESIQDESSSLAMLLVIAIACGVAVVGAVVFGVRWFVRRRHAKWLRTLPNERLALLAKRQEEEDFKESELNRTSNSMFQSQDEIPAFFRFAIPVVILGNIALFLSGHFNVAAEVSIVASFAGQELAISDVYAFSMARSAVEIWNAGGYILSLGILVFAGIWPYTRQILFLSLWFLPPEKCSISRRGWILNWLDALAKWSIVDIFTVIVTVVAFRLSIQNPETMILPSEFYSFDLLVHPVWGLYANLIAQLISQISSHIIIHYHRNIVHEATQSYRRKQACTVPDDESAQTSDTYGEKRDSLSNLKFSRPHKAEADKLVVRRIVHYAIPIGAVAACLFIVLGCILPSVGLEFFGLLGVAVEIGQEGAEASRELSALGLIGMLMEQAGYIGDARSYIGLFFLSCVLFITVLVVPLVQSAVLLYQWSWPMTGKMRKRVAVAVEYLQAWQYAEVYVVSVIVASWQLGDISAHLFNEYCESSADFLNTLAFFEVIGENDTQCFRTNASIMGGCYFMAAGALLLALFNSYVNSACHQYFRSRDEEIDQETQEVVWNKDVEASTPTTEKADYDFEVEVSTPTTEKGAYDFETIDTTDGTSPSPSYDETTNQQATCGKSGDDNRAGSTSSTSYYDKIRPTRVLFSDRFRWTLYSASASISSQ